MTNETDMKKLLKNYSKSPDKYQGQLDAFVLRTEKDKNLNEEFTKTLFSYYNNSSLVQKANITKSLALYSKIASMQSDEAFKIIGDKLGSIKEYPELMTIIDELKKDKLVESNLKNRERDGLIPSIALIPDTKIIDLLKAFWPSNDRDQLAINAMQKYFNEIGNKGTISDLEGLVKEINLVQQRYNSIASKQTVIAEQIIKRDSTLDPSEKKIIQNRINDRQDELNTNLSDYNQFVLILAEKIKNFNEPEVRIALLPMLNLCEQRLGQPLTTTDEIRTTPTEKVKENKKSLIFLKRELKTLEKESITTEVGNEARLSRIQELKEAIAKLQEEQQEEQVVLQEKIKDINVPAVEFKSPQESDVSKLKQQQSISTQDTWQPTEPKWIPTGKQEKTKNKEGTLGIKPEKIFTYQPAVSEQNRSNVKIGTQRESIDLDKMKASSQQTVYVLLYNTSAKYNPTEKDRVKNVEDTLVGKTKLVKSDAVPGREKEVAYFSTEEEAKESANSLIEIMAKKKERLDPKDVVLVKLSVPEAALNLDYKTVKINATKAVLESSDPTRVHIESVTRFDSIVTPEAAPIVTPEAAPITQAPIAAIPEYLSNLNINESLENYNKVVNALLNKEISPRDVSYYINDEKAYKNVLTMYSKTLLEQFVDNPDQYAQQLKDLLDSAAKKPQIYAHISNAMSEQLKITNINRVSQEEYRSMVTGSALKALGDMQEKTEKKEPQQKQRQEDKRAQSVTSMLSKQVQKAGGSFFQQFQKVKDAASENIKNIKPKK